MAGYWLAYLQAERAFNISAEITAHGTIVLTYTSR